MKLKNPDGPPTAKGTAPASKKKPASKSKTTASKKRKKADDDEMDVDRDEEQGEDEEHRKKKMRKGLASTTKSSGNAMADEDDARDEPVKEDEGDEIAKSSDELAEIDGIKPKFYLKDGAEKEVNSMSRCIYMSLQRFLSLIYYLSSSSTYKVKRTWDHYYW